jgi:predicted amidohydrolase YtcJ
MCMACAVGNAIFEGFDAMSRRTLLRGAGAAAMSAGFASSGFFCSEVYAQGAGDKIFTGGPIITIDDKRPSAEAVLVRGGRIAAVGTRAEVESKKNGTAEVVDLKGRTMVPGFFDPHSHVMLVGLQANSANLLPPPDGDGTDIAALQRILRDWMAKNKSVVDRYKLIIGFGYDDSQLKEQRHPTREDLDMISTEVPIYLIHQSSHLGACNSKALEFAGVTAATKDPTGGVYRRKPGGTEPDGVLEESAHTEVLLKMLAKLDRRAVMTMIKDGAAFEAKFGYTTAQEAALFSPLLPEVAEQGGFAIDVLNYPEFFQFEKFIKAPWLSRQYRNHYRMGGAKFVSDGSPQGKTAWLSRPYFVPPDGKGPDYVGYPAMPNEKLMEAVETAVANGWQVVCHCNGDAASDGYIAALREAAKKHGPLNDRRNVLNHGQTLRADQLDAMKALGIIPALFPMHTFYWGDWHRDSVLGPERAENISPTGWCLQRGMIFTTHHDAPVANPDAMRVLSATVTRRTRSGDILGPQHRVPVPIALKAMTLWPAYQHFEEGSKGSIEVGKFADFALLSDNPLTIDPDKLAGIKVEETIKEGATVQKGA